MAERQFSVARAFNSYAGDGSGEERYFTAGNAHELEGFLSTEELQYRIDEGYVSVSEATEEPIREFQRPEVVTEVDDTTNTPANRKARKRGTRVGSTVEE